MVSEHRLPSERSRKIVLAKKAAEMKKTGRLACEGCGFDFQECYGSRGETFIECHHVRPVAELGDGTPTRMADLMLLCANCHRMIHARRPWWSLQELRSAIAASGAITG
jgi:5-methylcytosine-specific restriction protein A